MEGSPFLRRFLPEKYFDGLLVRGGIYLHGDETEGVQPGGEDPNWLVQGVSCPFQPLRACRKSFPYSAPKSPPEGGEIEKPRLRDCWGNWAFLLHFLATQNANQSSYLLILMHYEQIALELLLYLYDC